MQINDLLEHTLFGIEAATKAQRGMNATVHCGDQRMYLQLPVSGMYIASLLRRLWLHDPSVCLKLEDLQWSSSANDLLEHPLFGIEAATKAQSRMNARSAAACTSLLYLEPCKKPDLGCANRPNIQVFLMCNRIKSGCTCVLCAHSLITTVKEMQLR